MSNEKRICRRMRVKAPPTRNVTLTFNPKNTIMRAEIRVDGYWGSGITVYGDDAYGYPDEVKKPSTISYGAGGYETKVFTGSNADRADNFGNAIKHAARIMRDADEGRLADDFILCNEGVWLDDEEGRPIEQPTDSVEGE